MMSHFNKIYLKDEKIYWHEVIHEANVLASCSSRPKWEPRMLLMHVLDLDKYTKDKTNLNAQVKPKN